MARARSPDWNLIKADYIKLNGEVKLKEFAEKHGVKYSTLRSRKNREKWDEEINIVATKIKNDATKPKDVATEKKKKKIEKVEKKIEAVEKLEEADLTEKQRLFCLYYIKSFNATMSAIKAGYAKNSAHVEGYRLLRNDKVKAEIKRLKGNMQQDIFIDAIDVLNKYIEIAFADITDYVSFGQEEITIDTDPEGRPIKRKINVVNLKDSSIIDGSILTEVSEGRDGVKVKLADKMKALEKLELYFDLLPDKFKRRIEEEKLELEKEKIESENKEQSPPIINIIDSWSDHDE
ncbi:MAG: terminase small subunit [Clostridiaceae bacterium]|nr:terminase small subunit [Clostridiaceae bacterium]MBW4860348.1 terminase small subunit [Clostridiaceae bacterium]MBW4867205.1 terminase small subunit [Clostridiaceae bacterium]